MCPARNPQCWPVGSLGSAEQSTADQGVCFRDRSGTPESLLVFASSSWDLMVAPGAMMQKQAPGTSRYQRRRSERKLRVDLDADAAVNPCEVLGAN